jgi:uncharacterized HAD superfamily protein
MKLGIDIDDVIADFIPALIVYYNNAYTANLTKDDFISYDFWEIWGGDVERAVRIVDNMFSDPQFCKSILPITSSFSSLLHLKSLGFDLFAITGRRDTAIKQTEEWLTRYFPDIFAALYFTNAYCLNGKSEKKSTICKAIGVELMVEDYPKHAIDCAENGIDVLLFDAPWNRSLKHPGSTIHRVHLWDEIVTHLS